MIDQQSCPECGAPWTANLTCQDDFHQMLAWEQEDMALRGDVHHLMVLCYYLQHPSLYSSAGLMSARKLLAEFVDTGISPAEVRKRDSRKVDSGNRSFSFKGTRADHGTYAHPIKWSMNARDVVRAGADQYSKNVRRWARAVLDDLRSTGNA